MLGSDEAPAPEDAGISAAPDAAKSGGVKMDLPAGLKVPDDVAPGSSFEVMATVSVGDDGMLTIQSIDGNAVSDTAEEAAEAPAAEAPAEEGGAAPSFLDAMEKGMGKKK